MQQFKNLTTMEEDFRYLGLVPNDGTPSLVRDISESIGDYNALAYALSEDNEMKTKNLAEIRKLTKEAMKLRLGGKVQDALHLEKQRDRLISKCKDLGYGEDAEDAATETEDTYTESVDPSIKVGDYVSFTDFNGDNSVGIVHSIEDDGYAIKADPSGNVLFSKRVEKISKEDFDNFTKDHTSWSSTHKTVDFDKSYHDATHDEKGNKIESTEQNAEVLTEGIKAQKLKRMSASERSKARSEYRHKKAKISRKLKKLRKKSSYKKKKAKLKKLKGKRSAGARKRFVMSSMEVVSNMAESWNKELGLFEGKEEKNLFRELSVLKTFASTLLGECKKAAQFYTEEEDKNDLSYVGDEFDALDDFEKEGDEVESDYDDDLTHVGDEWDDIEDADEEGDEVEDEEDHEYVGAVESIMVDLRCMIEDINDVISNADSKVDIQKAHNAMLKCFTESTTCYLENIFSYAGMDFPKEMNAKLDDKSTNKYVGDDQPNVNKVKPEDNRNDNNYVGKDDVNAEKSKPVSPGKHGDYVGDGKPEANKVKPVAPEAGNKYVGDDAPAARKEKPVKPDSNNGNYMGDEPYGSYAKEIPLQKKSAGEIPVIESVEPKSVESFKSMRAAMAFIKQGGTIIDPGTENEMSTSELAEYFYDDAEMPSDRYESTELTEDDLPFALPNKDGMMEFFDYKTGKMIPDYEGEFWSFGPNGKTKLHTRKEGGERAISGKPFDEDSESGKSVDSYSIAIDVARQILAMAIAREAESRDETKRLVKGDILQWAPDFVKEAGFNLLKYATQLAEKESIQAMVDKVLVAMPSEDDVDEDALASEIAHRLIGSGGGQGGELTDLVRKNVPNKDAAGLGYEMAVDFVDTYIDEVLKKE